MSRDMITKNDVNYYKKGQIPLNDPERFYFGVDINNDEHDFLFKKIGQDNIQNLFLLVYRSMQADKELTLEEWRKELEYGNNGAMIAIGKDNFDAFKKIIKKIRKHIESSEKLKKELKELLVEQFIVKNNIKSLLKEAIDSYGEDFDIGDLIDVEKNTRTGFLRFFQKEVLKRFQPSFTDKDKQILFIQLDFLLGEMLEDLDVLKNKE